MRGRPTKYSNQALETAHMYFEQCYSDDTKVPFVEELSLSLGVNDSTVNEWSKEYDEFSTTLGKIKVLQKLRLMQGGLDKRFQAHIAKFLLSANHGLSEKSQVEHAHGSFSLTDFYNRSLESEEDNNSQFRYEYQS